MQIGLLAGLSRTKWLLNLYPHQDWVAPKSHSTSLQEESGNPLRCENIVLLWIDTSNEIPLFGFMWEWCEERKVLLDFSTSSQGKWKTSPQGLLNPTLATTAPRISLQVCPWSRKTQPTEIYSRREYENICNISHVQRLCNVFLPSPIVGQWWPIIWPHNK